MQRVKGIPHTILFQNNEEKTIYNTICMLSRGECVEYKNRRIVKASNKDIYMFYLDNHYKGASFYATDAIEFITA